MPVLQGQKIMNKIAIVDIDDTLADMRSMICSVLNEHCDKELHWSNWNSFRVEELYGISYHDFFDLLKRNSVIENIRPHAESVEFMRNLKHAGYHITLLTARAWHPKSKEVTTRWLGEHGIVYDNLVVCNVEDDKSELVSLLYKGAAFTVDDSVTHCRSYVKNPDIKDVFVYDMPWNKCQVLDSSRAKRIDNLNQILELI